VAEPAVRWTEEQSQRWLTWLAQTLRKQSRTIFQLEELQPTWLPDPGAYYLQADIVLGGAIGALVAPVAIAIPSYFGPERAAADVSTAITTTVAGAVLGALLSGRSETVVERVHRAGPVPGDFDTGTHPIPAPSEPAPPPRTQRDPTPPERPAKDKGSSWIPGCLALQFIPLVVGAILIALNWLMSLAFANSVGLRNALGVLLVLIATILFRTVEARRLRATGRFIRPAEALGWSMRGALAGWAKALALGLPTAFVAARLLDGWLGNRPEAAIQLRGRGFSYEGPYDMGAHFLGFSEQGIALLLFLWGTIACAGLMLGGLRSRVVDLKVKPNQGLRLSLRNALFCLWAIGLPAGVLLGAGMLLIRPAAARLPFLAIPPTFPLEVLVARLTPTVGALQRDLEARVDAMPRMDSTVRRDSLMAWRQRGTLPLTAMMGAPTARNALRDTTGISRGIARQLLLDRNAFVFPRQRRVDRFVSMVGELSFVAGSDEAVARLFAPVPSVAPSSALDVRRDGGLALSLGLSLGIAIGGLAAMLNGGMAVVRHYLLRWRLARMRVAPLDYTAFLDHACDRLGFLEHVGGGYMFIHRMVLEHFAELAKPAPRARRHRASIGDDA
jgi:hypothetical protein